MEILVGLAVLVFVFCLAIGWVVPLVVGIIWLRRKAGGGVAMTVIGGVWGVLALSGIGIGVSAYRQVGQYTKVEDFDPLQYQGPKGNIVVPHKGESSLEVTGDGGKRMRLPTKDGVFVVPAGTYSPTSYKAVDKDSSGQEWEASSYLSLPKPGKISVKDGSRQDLDVGPPFVASVSVSAKGQEQATLDLKLTGRDGNQYTISRKGRLREAPGFEVRDKSGEVVWQGKFAYG